MFSNPVFFGSGARLEKFPLPHVFSLKQAGNMARRFEEPAGVPEAVRRREEFISLLGFSPRRAVGMIAEHGSRVVKICVRNYDGFVRCDALVTFIPETALSLAQADCFPVLLTDKEKSFAALVHAGWRGLNAGVVSEVLSYLEREGNVEPREVIVAVGPGIRSCCFNNPEVRGLKNWQPFLTNGLDGEGVDLLAKLLGDLVACGVEEENIEAAAACVCCSKENGAHSFWSHRRHALGIDEKEGRFLTVVGIK